ncbi:MAG: flagellar motor protein MotB [Defluviitaleaceae bacterium]|nr:flagellar motor protein MotB [Defluviitaleaceae bacterium]
MMKQNKAKKTAVVGGAAVWASMFALALCVFVYLFSLSRSDPERLRLAVASYMGAPTDSAGLGGEKRQTGGTLTAGAANRRAVDDEAGTNNKGAAAKKNDAGTVSRQNVPDAQNAPDLWNSIDAQGKLEQIASNISAYLAEHQLTNKIKVETVAATLAGSEARAGTKAEPAFVRMTVPADMLFAQGKAGLKKEMLPLLETAAGELKLCPDARISIEAHTDTTPVNTPQFPNNWVLSSVRAVNIGLYFIEQGKIDPARVTATGMGGYRPLAPNDTADNMAENRRVEMYWRLEKEETGN